MIPNELEAACFEAFRNGSAVKLRELGEVEEWIAFAIPQLLAAGRDLRSAQLGISHEDVERKADSTPTVAAERLVEERLRDHQLRTKY